MRLSRLKAIAGFFLAGVLTVPAWAAKTAQPGSLNYVEGQAAISDQSIDSQSVGSAVLQPGETLSTQSGKAEVLLTPGVFLRVGDASSIQMMNAGLADTQLKLDQGEAMVEVTEIHDANHLRILQDGVTVQLVKNGLYDFDAAQNQVRVLSGKAVLFAGDDKVTVDGGHQVDLNQPGRLKSEKFDQDAFEQSELYRWSSLRSSYLAEANTEAARVYVNNGDYASTWSGAGWYWDPWYSAYTYVPANGIFYSPFGFGFYSPLVVYRAPVFFTGRPFFHHFGPTFRPPVVVNHPVVGPTFRPGPERGHVVPGPGRVTPGPERVVPGPARIPAPGNIRPGGGAGQNGGAGMIRGGGGAVMHNGGGFHGAGGGRRG